MDFERFDIVFNDGPDRARPLVLGRIRKSSDNTRSRPKRCMTYAASRCSTASTRSLGCAQSQTRRRRPCGPGATAAGTWVNPSVARTRRRIERDADGGFLTDARSSVAVWERPANVGAGRDGLGSAAMADRLLIVARYASAHVAAAIYARHRTRPARVVNA